MPTPVQIKPDTQFQQFVRFAEQALRNGNEKAIARQGDITPADPQCKEDVRMISAATDDRVYAIRRSAASKTANDAVRETFRKAVSDMFFGNIPESVEKMMNMKDFGHGKPLTARRIKAVRDAIANEELKMLVAKRKILDASSNLFSIERKADPRCQPDVGLSDLQRRRGAVLLLKHVPQIEAASGNDRQGADKCTRLLANYIVRILQDPNLEANADQYVVRIASNISKFRDFPLGDPRAKSLDDAFLAFYQHILQELGSVDANSIDAGFTKDITRYSSCTINGRKFAPGSPPGDVVNALKRAVTNPKHLKALELLMSQDTGNALETFMMRMPIPKMTDPSKGVALHTAKGAEMVVGAPLQGSFYGMPLCCSTNTAFRLDISPDGKSAKLAYTDNGYLRLGISDTDGASMDKRAATYTITQEWTLDLSGDEPKLVEHHLGQTFDA